MKRCLDSENITKLFRSPLPVSGTNYHTMSLLHCPLKFFVGRLKTCFFQPLISVVRVKWLMSLSDISFAFVTYLLTKKSVWFCVGVCRRVIDSLSFLKSNEVLWLYCDISTGCYIVDRRNEADRQVPAGPRECSSCNLCAWRSHDVCVITLLCSDIIAQLLFLWRLVQFFILLFTLYGPFI